MNLKILADSNIIFVCDAFKQLGNVEIADGTKIKRENLIDKDILLVRSRTKVNKELLEGTKVKFVASATSGIDHIDVNYLSQNNIGFAYASGSNSQSVAEYVIAAITYYAQKNNVELTKLKLGIIGVGNIGSKVFNLATTLGIKCLLNDPPKKAITNSEMYLPLNEVLKESDIITLHVPLTITGQHATINMVNEDFFSLVKKGCALINTSRGSIINENALKKFRNKLGFLVLDVWNNEPTPDPEVVSLCDIATPHIAGYSYDGKVKGTQMICDFTCSYFFKTNKWNAPKTELKDNKIIIEEKEKSNPVFNAILKAYPIFKDHKSFIDYNSLQSSKRAEFFEKIRKNYNYRYEFSNYLVVLDKIRYKKEREIISALGFSITEN
jgi:erythronate-4-phosphate dehydrogenase